MPSDVTHPGLAANTLASSTASAAALPRPVAIPMGRAVVDIQRSEVAQLRAKRRRWVWLAWGAAPPSWLTSAVLHAAVLIILSLITTARPAIDNRFALIATMDNPASPDSVEELRPVEGPGGEGRFDLASPAEPQPLMPLPDNLADMDLLPVGPRADRIGSLATSVDALLTASDLPTGGGLEGRSPAGRARLSGKWDPDGSGDRAIRRGLQWLIAHQRPDGSWNFNHQFEGRCPGLCRYPGTNGSTTGATAVALLALLGAGETHKEGEYQDQIRRALYYLSHKAIELPQGVDLQDGTMYAHGLAAIALCEAYALTKDENLRPWAQGAIDFVAYAQDPKGGGWRYLPREPGDLTVTGWQIMALKSGQMAQLSVASIALHDANRFLDQVQSDDGALYGYQKPGKERTTTAVGLLCRMYQGWPRRHPPLQRGIVNLYQWGPSDHDMYYNYYATAALHHFGGGYFERWHADMRAMLLKTQADQGHENGSWFFASQHCDPGGRLLSTALAIMTLEVHYRHMPLYQDSVDDE